jgi:hypothetical protein
LRVGEIATVRIERTDGCDLFESSDRYLRLILKLVSSRATSYELLNRRTLAKPLILVGFIQKPILDRARMMRT